MQTQTSVYVARGVLIESTRPTWLYGTASEHSVYYQYEFYKSANVLAGMIQTEQPYYQPTPPPPAPFEAAVGVFRGDPAFPCTENDPCDSGWGLRIIQSSQITILGAGLYSWFSSYTQDCLATSSCQRTMAELPRSLGEVTIHNLVTIGATNMIRTEQIDGEQFNISAKENQAVDFHPFWSQLSKIQINEHERPGPGPPEPVLSGGGRGSFDWLKADLSSSCFIFPSCVDLDNPLISSCETGYTKVGAEHCSSEVVNYGKPICCKTEHKPDSCTWRANTGDIKSDCNGRCNAGETLLYWSVDGGQPNDGGVERCARGSKSFCCTSNSYNTITTGCTWVNAPRNW